MDFPYSPDDVRARVSQDGTLQRPYQGPIAAWMLVALIGLVLGTAALAAAFATDSRDFAARHGTVLQSRAL